MNLKQTRLHILHKTADLSRQAKTGISLHCHTEYSKEMMDFIPLYADKFPIVNLLWQREHKKYTEREGKQLDFSTAFWSPPLEANEVYKIEKTQINEAGLKAIVSLTDHDSIKANLQINEPAETAKIPISLEWTVPFEYGFFHLGVHNLPPERAVELTKTLLDYTFGENPTNEKLHEIFALLNEIPQILVILNHPLWDIEMVGKEKHLQLLKNFTKEHGHWIHALEINGFRTWSENKAVLEMAESLGLPVCTGGDRHGCQPNTVINLTNAETFDEFAHEIRRDKHSEVILMPEYRQPIHSRQLQSFSEILKTYPEFSDGKKHWFDRVHFDIGDGQGLNPLSIHGWERGPAWLRGVIWTLGVLGSPKMRPIFTILRKKKDRVPKETAKTDFEFPNSGDLTSNFSSDTA